ncbi:septal ring lytic transglycosylase RlpA family protein [Thalassotalea fusca]
MNNATINGLRALTTSALILLTACSTQTGRYQQRHDSTPTRLPSTAELVDAIPRAEAKSKGGNRNYTVLGKSYKVLQSADNFVEHGVASWYGKKFHGHLTSNGEIYNMYAMSAAHKNLPLPSYVKVTNLDNNKTVIVRVNDRGPFHDGRVIDLSYSAAYKLDMLKTGTANVKLEAITSFDLASTKKVPLVKKSNATQQFIQVFATRNLDVARKTGEALTALYQIPSVWPKSSGVYRVQLGPLNNNDKVNELLNTLKSNGYPKAFIKTIGG